MNTPKRSQLNRLLTQMSGLLLILLFTASLLICSQVHTASQQEKLEEMKTLIEKDPALINPKDNNGRTVFGQAHQLREHRYLPGPLPGWEISVFRQPEGQ